MKIDLGNFGNAQRDVVNNAVDRGNPEDAANTKIATARNTLQQQTRVNQAVQQVGQSAQQLGGEMMQKMQQLAAQQSAVSIQDYQIHRQGVIQSAQDKIDAGELKADEVKDYIQKGMQDFKRPDIAHLTAAGKLQQQKGFESVDTAAGADADHLFRGAHKIEMRATTDSQIANNERIALNGGPDVSQAAATYDTPGFIANAREAYGAEYQKVIDNAKGNLWKASALNQVLKNRDSHIGLDEIGRAITDPNGLYYGKLDPDSQLSIMGQIETRKSNLEAKALAEETRRQAAAARAEAHQAHVDQVAFNTLQQAREFVTGTGGDMPNAEWIDRVGQKLAGSAYAGQEKSLVQMAAQVVQFGQLPFVEQNRQQAELAATMAQGNSPELQKTFNLRQQVMNKRQAELHADTITGAARILKQDIPPLPIDLIGKGGTWQEKQANMQAFSEALYQRKALFDKAKSLDPSVSTMYLTKDEQTAWAKQLKDATPQDRAKMVMDLQNAGGKLGPELVKQVGATKSDQVAAYHMAVNPASEATALIIGGQTLKNAKGANYKAPPASKTQGLLDGTYGGAMSPTMRNTLGNTVNDAYIQYRANKNADPNEFDRDDYMAVMEKVAGKVIQYGSAGKIAVPPDTDAGQFRDKLYSTIKALPDGVNIDANLQTGQATLTAVSSNSYMVTRPSGGPWVSSQTHQPIYVTVN